MRRQSSRGTCRASTSAERIRASRRKTCNASPRVSAGTKPDDERRAEPAGSVLSTWEGRARTMRPIARSRNDGNAAGEAGLRARRISREAARGTFDRTKFRTTSPRRRQWPQGVCRSNAVPYVNVRSASAPPSPKRSPRVDGDRHAHEGPIRTRNGSSPKSWTLCHQPGRQRQHGLRLRQCRLPHGASRPLHDLMAGVVRRRRSPIRVRQAASRCEQAWRSRGRAGFNYRGRSSHPLRRHPYANRSGTTVDVDAWSRTCAIRSSSPGPMAPC